MLRRALLLWRAQETIEEVVDYCVRNSIDEVMWKVDVEEFNHGLLRLDMLQQYLPWIDRARQALSENGILSSINPWTTMNHADRGRDMTTVHPRMHWMVDASGAAAKACACPLSGAWQEWLVESYRLYASTRPNILWLEDDFRTYNHRPVVWGCYCPDHMRALSETIGVEIDREELVSRLLAPGVPDPIRCQWFELQGRIMIGVAARVQTAVHAESPETRLGLMCSNSLDGRWWLDAVTALAGPHEPVARPSLGPYQEARATALLLDEHDHQKELCCLPSGTRICPELENMPYTSFSKSSRFTRLELGIAQLLGHADITLNLYDFLGTPLSEDQRFGRLLRETKPVLSALASRCGPGGRERGVQVLFDKRSADVKRLDAGDGFDQLLRHDDAEGWARPLQACDLPVIWGPAPVCCVTGQVMRALDESSVQRILSGGLLLDGSALGVLHEEGYGHLTGLSVSEWTDQHETAACAEEIINERFGGAPRAYTSLTGITPRTRLLHFVPGPDAILASRFVDVDRQPISSGMVLFENELGGRIAAYPYDLTGGTGASFMNPLRKRQLAAVIRWLGRGAVDLLVGSDAAWMIPFRRDYPDYTLIGIANLETDEWPQLCLSLSTDGKPGPKRLLLLSSQGTWEQTEPAAASVEHDILRIHLMLRLGALDFTALIVEWEG